MVASIMHRVSQDPMQQNLENSPPCEIWGDKLGKKSENTLCVSFQNINGFGYLKNGQKAEEIYDFIGAHEIDVCLLAEMNVNWRLVSKKNTIDDLTRGWFENQRCVTSYNQYDRSYMAYQPGGTAVITQGEMSLRCIKSGHDDKKMGRWSW